MPSILKQKQTALHNIGIEITDKSSVNSLKHLLNPKNSLSRRVTKDEQGFYNLINLPFITQKKGELYDGEKKILSWDLSSSNDLILDIYCLEQVNLWDPLCFNSLFVNAQGPLFLGSTITCIQNMTVKSYSLACNKSVTCGQNLVIETVKGIGFLAPIICNGCIVRSETIYQFAPFEAKEQADFTCNVYSSKKGCELASPIFRLVAENAFIEGQTTITEKCFISANSLSFGLSDNTSNGLFSGEIHIKADYLYGLGAAQIVINSKGKPSIIEVKSHLNVDAEAIFTVDNTTLHFDSVTLKGELHCTQTQLSINEIVNSGNLHFQQGNLVINQSLTMEAGGLFKLNESHALIHENRCTDGKTIYHKSIIVGKKQFIYQGSLDITGESTICLTDELSASPKSSLKVDNSAIETGKKMTVRGLFEINNSQVDAAVFACDSKALKGEGYFFSSSSHLSLSGNLDLVKGTIYAENLTIKGKINLDDTRIRSQYLQIKTDEGYINNLRLQTSHLNVVGGSKAQEVNFTRSVMTAHRFTSENHITLELTTLNLVGSDESVQSLGEGVILIKSRIVSKKPILQAKDSTLNLQNNSSISAPILFTEGEVSSDFSVIFSQRLSQIQGAFTAKNTNLYISEQFTAMQSDVVIADNSRCIVPTVNFLNKTQTVLSNNSIILAQNSVTVDKLSITDSTLVTSKMKTHGASQISKSVLAVEDLQIYHAFDVANQSQVSAEALITAAKESLITVHDSKIQTKSMGISGQMTLSDAQLVVDDKLRVGREGDLVLEPGSIIMSEYLAVIGQMHVTQKEDSEDKEDRTVPAQLRINDKFIITSKAKIDGNAPLVAEVGEFLNFGSINLSNSLATKGALFYNSGSLEADSIFLGYDDAVVNTGMIAANNMTIHSNFINPFGRVYVKESMSCSGFYGFNLGLICANNYSNTTLLSLDCGLVLPNLSADLKYVFSVGNLVSAGRTILSTMTPGYSNLINFACMIPSGIQAASSVYDLCKTKSFDDIKNMRRHEWMPIAGQLYSLGMLGFNAATTGYHAGVEFKNLNAKGLFSGFAAPKWTDIGLKTATIFAGSYRDTSLIHLNMGLSLAGSTNHSSLLHVNTGVEASILSHSINTHWLYNEGISTGAESSFTASTIVNNGTMSGAASLFVSADTFINKDTAILSGHNAMVKVGSMKQEGRLDLDEGALHVDDLKNTGVITLDKMALDVGDLAQNNKLTMDDCGGDIKHFQADEKTASTTIQNSALKGESFNDKGQLELKNVSFKYTDSFEVAIDAKVHSTNVTVDTGNFTNKGNWEYDEMLVVHTKKAVLSEDGVINGQKTVEAELFVEKEKKPEETQPVKNTDETHNSPSESENKTDTGSTTKEEKTFNPKHVFILDADEAIIDGQLSGGDYTQIRGLQPEKVEGATEEVEIKKSHSVTFGDNAHIDLRYGSLQAENVANTGQVHLDSFSLDVGHMSQDGLLTIEKSSGTISQLTDTKNANTVVSQSVLKGDFARFEGHLDASKSSFNYQTSFEIKDTAKAHTDNVSITTQTFREAGELQYEHYLEINADTAVIESGAVVNGKQTSEDKLFQDKPQVEAQAQPTEEKPATVETPKSEGDKTSEEKKEPEKDFKPQHILSINTNKLKVDGELGGGDYTKINGKAIEPKESSEAAKDAPESKCESIEIGKTAKINLQYGNITSERLQVNGNIDLSNFDLKIDSTNISLDGHLGLSKVKLVGTDLVNAGEFKLTDSTVEMSSHIILENNAHERFENVGIKTGKFIDHSQMSEQGQVSILTDSYVHDGKVVSLKSEQEGATPNLLYIESKTAELKGEAALDSAIYKIESFDDAENLLRGDGQYNNYQFSTTLGIETNKDIHLTGKVNRECGLHVKGKSVTVNTNYSTEQDLTFISTEGNITLSGQLHAGNVYGKSEKAIATDASIHANALIHLEAKEGFENNAGTLNGDQVAVKAKSIKNNKGVINGRSDVYLDATGGNIENHGGMIRGGKYTQLTATGDVTNLCSVSSHWNGFDWVNDYDGGLIAGGTGENTKDVGLYIKADGKVISDASDFVSDNVNYIEGDKGIELGARQQTYTVNKTKSGNWFKTKEHIDVTTQVKGSTVHSAKGANILRTEHGGLESVATQFSSPGGTQIYSRDDVNLYNIKAGSYTYDSKSTFCGLKKSKHEEYHQDVTPTLFVDNGLTRIVSSEGSVDARGALFIGAGDLEIEAKHRIKLGCDTLDNTVIDKNQSVGVSLPGVQAYNTLKGGGNWIDAATAEDATVAKINRLAHSGNTTEALANASNLGVNLYNTTSSVMRGLGNDTLSKEMLSRYGLGGADGFSPTVTVSMTKTKTTSNYQTLGAGGVDRGGNVKLKAGDGVDLENGVRVHAGGNIDIDAPELIERNATLHSSFDQKTQTASLNVTVSGIQGGSYSESRTHAEATTHVNAELSAGGNIRLHHGDGAMQSVVLDGGTISCKTLDADIEHLTIISKQDTSQSSTLSFGASTNGQVSFYEGNSRSKITKQNSGIHVEEGINNNGHTVHVGEAYMEGGKITTNGQNNIVIDHLTTVELHDEAHTSGFGLSVNINDLGRLAGNQSTNQTGEQAIAVGELTYDHLNYQATQTAVIHGEQGTNIVIGQLDGNLHTASADGCTITKNEEMHLVLDIPITNKSYLESASQNFKAGTEKLNKFFGRDVSLDVMPGKRVDEIAQPEKVDAAEDDDGSDFDDAFGLGEYDPLDDYGDDDFDVPELGEKHFEDAREIKNDEQERDEIKVEGYTKEQMEQLENSPKVRAALSKVEAAKKALKNEKTKKHEEELKKAIQHSIAVMMKEAASNGWDVTKGLLSHQFEESIQKIIGSAADGVNLTTKTYMNRFGVVVGFAFNLSIASIDGKEDVFKEAIAQSGSDFVFGIAINYAGRLGMGALLTGGISWAFVGLEVLDTLFYDPTFADEMLKSSTNFTNQSYQFMAEGRNFDALGLQLLANDQNRLASMYLAGHSLAHVMDPISNGIKWTWDKVSGSTPKHQPKMDFDRNPAYNINNSNRFFTDKPTKTRIEEKTLSYRNTE